MDELGIQHYRAAATSAVREADNGYEFVQAVLGRGDLGNRWTLGALAGSPEGVPNMDSHEWWSLQARRLMADGLGRDLLGKDGTGHLAHPLFVDGDNR